MGSRVESTINPISTSDGSRMCRIEDNTFNPDNKYLLCPGKRFVFQYNTTVSKMANLVGVNSTLKQNIYTKSTDQQVEEKIMLNKFILRKENQDEFQIAANFRPDGYQVVIINKVDKCDTEHLLQAGVHPRELHV